MDWTGLPPASRGIYGMGARIGAYVLVFMHGFFNTWTLECRALRAAIPSTELSGHVHILINAQSETYTGRNKRFKMTYGT